MAVAEGFLISNAAQRNQETYNTFEHSCLRFHQNRKPKGGRARPFSPPPGAATGTTPAESGRQMVVRGLQTALEVTAGGTGGDVAVSGVSAVCADLRSDPQNPDPK